MGIRRAKALILLFFAFAQLASAQAPVNNTPVANGIALDMIVTTLQSNGFQAKILDLPRTNELLLGQILTGISGVNVMISVYKCQNSTTNFVCAMGFMTIFKDVTDLNESKLRSLNDSSFAKVVQPTGGEAKDSGLRVIYVYPCEGFDDPKFVLMVLKNFSSAVTSVIAAYKKLQLPTLPSIAAPAKPQ
jgi:hypothetical protein